MEKIRIGIAGYGNIARGVETAIKTSPDTELVAVFTRRKPEDLMINSPGVKVVNFSQVEEYKDTVDVMILCTGSAKDLPVHGVEFAKLFNTVDSYDNHAQIPQYLRRVNESALSSGKVSIISIGWDPGLFSIMRMISEAVLPEGSSYTFWGRGVSQGHSDAIRRVKGVKYGIQYTIPLEKAVEAVRRGETPNLSARDKHMRECYVVCEEGADKSKIESDIKNMPDYFAPYDTKVNFISEEEFKENHSKMPHGGLVIRNGTTGEEKQNKHIMEFSLKLDSNPEFTGSVLLAYARAAYKMNLEGMMGAKTIFDVPLFYLSPRYREDLVKELL
ncbi:MAG: diaminopimelate dehydrogenase [Bacillota bacterium]|jgi:diaminopimelate dehydrogenase|nr:diaminopimelate dehydrogenase [Bacillota bacterium]NLL59364.1 diaminopimelate dehydrogenase [Tissierellia bacterium]